MFTLMHELAHLWVGEAGISNFAELLPSRNAVEIFCNKVSAEFLIPAHEMGPAWEKSRGHPRRCEQLARLFKVSPIVVARRALDLELISRTEFFAFIKEQLATAATRRARAAGGGDFYRTLGARLGKRFPAAVYGAAKAGRIEYRDAYQLTGLSGASYDRFGRELGFAV